MILTEKRFDREADCPLRIIARRYDANLHLLSREDSLISAEPAVVAGCS
jgi:hypothetical protein